VAANVCDTAAAEEEEEEEEQEEQEQEQEQEQEEREQETRERGVHAQLMRAVLCCLTQWTKSPKERSKCQSFFPAPQNVSSSPQRTSSGKKYRLLFASVHVLGPEAFLQGTQLHVDVLIELTLILLHATVMHLLGNSRLRRRIRDHH
jgi:FtsZ-interacting cell division protein YlmF